MQDVMKETEDQGERKSPDLQINRGVELMLRTKKQVQEEPKTFQIKFEKMVSFLERELRIYLNFSFDIKRKSKK